MCIHTRFAHLHGQISVFWRMVLSPPNYVFHEMLLVIFSLAGFSLLNSEWETDFEMLEKCLRKHLYNFVLKDLKFFWRKKKLLMKHHH